ncbi:GPI transamidase component PIG-T-like [Dendronephthya gigantea]|uniref:GPI transamidase component PIG-T-like n=1 Tax=Dendronephthya gigantea TaxID=151771 RepID=UPI00106A96FF|nr:GPI transamidase component PIG-T-like [Dendronephthya gigantea]
MASIWWHGCFICLLTSLVVGREEFHEELYIKPFPSGDVLTYFQFTTLWSEDIRDKNSFSHYNLFPKSLGQIVTKYSVEELHLSLTQGFWNAYLWDNAMQPASPGAELAVWFQDKVLLRVDKEWSGLTNALSGQFCASLNFIKPENTASPNISFRRRGLTSSIYNDSQTLRYASLPGEIVCTENLTPWKKLLPCNSKSGLSSLLNSLLIYKVKYHSMSIHLRTICEDADCQLPLLELQQTMSIVTDPVVRSGSNDWSLRKLFGHPLRSSCPLATTSQVFIDVTENDTDNNFSLKPKPTRFISKSDEELNRQFAVYNLKGTGKVPKLLTSDSGFNPTLKWQKRSKQAKPPSFFVHRFLTGYGEEHAGIQCEMRNHHKMASIKIVYFQILPWHFRVYLHTLRVRINDVNIKPEYIDFVPSRDRERPTKLEIVLTVPPDSIVTVKMEFDRVFLKWTEHPPDAHHGFYLPSGVITAKLVPNGDSNRSGLSTDYGSLLSQSLQSTKTDDNLIRIYTEVLLVSLPTPDFSMPYNVICLTCTVVAIAFGSLYNLSTKRLQEVPPGEPTTLLGKIKQKLSRLKERIIPSTKSGNKPKKEKKND